MEEPERDLQQLLAEHPSDVKARTDLGLLYYSSGRLDEALAEFQRALESVPNDPVASYNLAAVLCARGDAATALDVVQPAIEHSPRIALLHYGRACALNLLHRRDEAIASFHAALGFDADFASAWYGLGTAYQAQGDDTSAMHCFARACELDPDHPAARHMVNALAGRPEEEPPAGFVRDLFDFYASSFDAHLLETLDYRAPQVLLEALGPRIHGRKDLVVLDLGCGTGLFGARIRPHAALLTGVDVSPAMLVRAREKSIYDELHEADIVDHLSSVPTASCDLITAADVFGYLGVLDGVISGARDALRAGGLLAFTVEADSGGDYSLSRTGRYRHSRTYLERLRIDSGFEELARARATLRLEANEPCEGLVVVWRRAHTGR